MFGKKAPPPINGLLAQGCRIEGNLLFTEGMRIDGEVSGNIRAITDQSSLLVVSETARVEGGIVADHVIINGTVNGPIHAVELLELQPRARVDGEVTYGAIEIHHGAVLAGTLKHLPLAEEKPLLKLAANNT